MLWGFRLPSALRLVDLRQQLWEPPLRSQEALFKELPVRLLDR